RMRLKLGGGSLFGARSLLGASVPTACFPLSSPRLGGSVAAAAPGGRGGGAPGPRDTRALARGGRGPSGRSASLPPARGRVPAAPPPSPTRRRRLPSASSRRRSRDQLSLAHGRDSLRPAACAQAKCGRVREHPPSF